MSHEQQVVVNVGVFEPLLQSGVTITLGGDPRLMVAGAGLTPDQLLRTREQARVAVVDAAGFASPVALLEFVEAMGPAQTLVVVDPEREQLVSALLTTGVGSCVPTDCSAAGLRAAVVLCAEGLQVRAPVRPLLQELTAAEERVLSLIRIGQSNSEIAAGLHVSVETVRTHARQIYRKLEVPGREALRLVDARAFPQARRRG